MTYAKRTDANQREIFAALRQMGYSVVDTSRVGNGFGDGVAGKWGDLWIIEVKSSEKAKYTRDQIEFRKNWKGKPPVRLNSLEEAIAWAKGVDSPRASNVPLDYYERPDGY